MNEDSDKSAPIQPPPPKSYPLITDLFSVEELQALQDAFADATNVASLITFPDGTPITQPSNFCRLCSDIIRSTDKGKQNCFRSDSIIGLHNSNGPTIQSCLSGGLWDAGVSITVGDHHLGNWLVGQIKNDAIDDEKVVQYAQEIGADENEFRQALSEVPILSMERFEKVARLIFLLANHLSRKAFQNLQQTQFTADRDRAEEAIRRSEIRLRSFVENSPLGIFRAIVYGDRFTMVSPALTQMLGYETAAELLAIRLSTDLYLNPEDRIKVLEQLAQGESFSAIEAKWKRKEGSAITVRLSGRLIQEEGNRLVEGIAEDVTEYKKLEQQFRQAQKMDAIGRLAGGVAHDFNNVLMIVGVYADLILQAQAGDEKVRGYARQIQQTAIQAVRVTRQLLAFSRRQMIEPEIVDLNTVINQIQKILPALLGEDIQVLTRLSSSWSVKVDRSQVDQILVNLATNARDAMPKGGRLLLETENVTLDAEYATQHPPSVPGDYVMLAVSDTGIGMNADTKSRLFEPFFTTKELGRGTGLGLASVYGSVKQSGGFIWVDSELGRGTTFRIYLPQVEGCGKSPGTPEPKREPDGHETILVVEDEDPLRVAIAEYLQVHGYNVMTAADGNEALRICEQSSGTIVGMLTDLVMPGMDGIELAQSLRSRYPGIRVLYMSGYNDRVVKDLTGNVVLLQKPFTLSTLLRKLREVLNSDVS